MTFLVLVLAAYLLGSIPTGQVLVKRAKKVDIRDYGSGNIGAANVFRVAGPRAAALVLLADLAKGFVPVVIAKSILTSHLGAVFVGLAAASGHIWSIYLGFRGGKGVLTTLGGLLALAPAAGLISAVVGAIVMAVFRYSSLGSLTGTMAGAATLLFLIVVRRKPPAYLAQVLVPPALIIATHRENIQNLLRGTERRLAVGTEQRSRPSSK
ncbi:MAG: glycerol-3-phosphate 1-O-acyltransferase PlsY [Dehalococcoidia bacterium]